MLAAAGSVAGCGTSDERPPAGRLVLSIQSDLSIPKDIDAYDLQVSVLGKVVLDDRRALGPDAHRIPTTVTLAPSERSTDPVTIRLTALKEGDPRVYREVVTTVPRDRVAVLRLPIEFLCLDRVVVDDDGSVQSDCGGGKSCVAGACRPREIDAKQLPDFEAPRVPSPTFPEAGPSSCFDTVACFAEGRSVSVDLGSCTVTPPGGSVNLALVMPRGSAGICSGASCLVPLDRDPETGWRSDESGDIHLPQAACRMLESGPAVALVVTDTCESKTPELSVCRDWSTAEPTPSDGDAGGTLDGGIDGGDPDAAPVGPPPRVLHRAPRRVVGGSSNASLSTIGTIVAAPPVDAGSSTPSVLDAGAT